MRHPHLQLLRPRRTAVARTEIRRPRCFWVTESVFGRARIMVWEAGAGPRELTPGPSPEAPPPLTLVGAPEVKEFRVWLDMMPLTPMRGRLVKNGRKWHTEGGVFRLKAEAVANILQHNYRLTDHQAMTYAREGYMRTVVQQPATFIPCCWNAVHSDMDGCEYCEFRRYARRKKLVWR